jgi:PAS domain S-box-containing protein
MSDKLIQQHGRAASKSKAPLQKRHVRKKSKSAKRATPDPGTSHDFFRAVLEASVSPMFVLDREHRVILWNRACETLTGVPASEVVGTDGHWRAFYSEQHPTIADFIIAEDFESVEQYYDTYTASDASISSERFYPNVGGKPRYLLIDASPIFDNSGNLVAAVETLKDITARKIAEIALQDSMDRFNTVLDGLDTVVYVSDMQTYDLLYLNRYAMNQFGDGVGRPCYEILQNLQDKPCSFCTNDRLCKPDGSPAGIYVWEFQNPRDGKWYELHDQAISWVDGRTVRLTIATDITLRKEAEAELTRHRMQLSELVQERTAELRDANESLQMEIIRHQKTEAVLAESEERFRSIYAQSPIGIELYDAEGRLFDVNDAALSIFGVLDVQDLKGFSLFHDPNVSEDVKSRFEDGETVRFEASFDFEKVKNMELYNTTKSGLIYLDVIITPLGYGENRSITGYLVQIQDVTEQKHLEQQLRHAQKMEAIGQLAGGIAHDFNNIISAISNYAYLLSLKIPSDDNLQEYVQRIMSSSERAAHLTHSLLSFSRKQMLNPRPIDLNGVVRSIEKLLHRLIGEDVSLEVFYEENPLPLMADSHQLEQVLMNLCTNARDAMPEGGSMHIVTSREERQITSQEKWGSFAVLNVTDSGKGMDAATKTNIFEPFFTTKDVGKGTGLGLSIVYSIVSQHGGFIEVFSAPGKGSTFKLYFPLLQSQVTDEKKKDLPIPAGKGETILLAEDDPEVRAVTREILTGFGYQVIEAEDGEDAVQKFRAFQQNGGVNLLMFDILMPKLNGRDAYLAIKELDPAAKILFVSGYTADILQRKRVLEEGFTLLNKPVAPDEVLRKVREIIDGEGETAAV